MVTREEFDELKKRVDSLAKLVHSLSTGHETVGRILGHHTEAIEKIPEAFNQIETVARTLGGQIETIANTMSNFIESENERLGL